VRENNHERATRETKLYLPDLGGGAGHVASDGSAADEADLVMSRVHGRTVLERDASGSAGAQVGHEPVLLEDAEGGASFGGDDHEDAATRGEGGEVLVEGDHREPGKKKRKDEERNTTERIKEGKKRQN